MLRPMKSWQAIVVVASIVLSCGALTALPAQGAATAPSAPALPDPLTKESVRELMSRLSDEQARTLLIEQLDRATVTQPTTKGEAMSAMAGMSGMAGMAGKVGENAGTVRDRIHALYEALVALPATTQELVMRLTGRAGPSALWLLGGYVAAMLVIGWIVERAYDYGLRRYRAQLLDVPASTFSARAFQLGTGLVLEFGGIVVFTLGALAVFLVLWRGEELQRVAVLLLLFAVIVVRIAVVIARFLLAPGPEQQRLLPFADRPARRLRWFAMALAALYGAALMTRVLLAAGSVDATTLDLFTIVFWILGIMLVLVTTWLVRRPIADLIRGEARHGSVIGWIADLWHVAATVYFLALFTGGISDVLTGTPSPAGRGFASVFVVIALPIIDMALCRALAAVAARGKSGDGLVAAYESIFRRSIHIIVTVAGMLLIAQLWQLDLFRIAQNRLGGKIASSLFGISIVLLATYMIWAIARAAIDRRLAAEGERPEDVPATRLRTLLPILRATILVTITLMAGMSILAALGVDILPLLAGASVVGVAIGFGSQTLVRDIVSGAFFLMDDAFRLGEYIEVGDAKGRVEKINVRSVFLRHHRGALNVLPYGEIKRLRNTSRDWQIHVLEFRLTYDTSMLEVKKILKRIGEELSADPDYAPDILQPLKSAGVLAAEDSGVLVRAKFTARPTSNAWVVRRVAYDKIIRAFREAGIQFAHRQVTVEVPPGQDTASVKSAAGAAAVADLEATASSKKAAQT